MNEMSLENRQAITQAIQCLIMYIHKNKYSPDPAYVINLVTGTGEVLKIRSVEDAELCKNHLQTILDLEKLYARI